MMNGIGDALILVCECVFIYSVSVIWAFIYYSRGLLIVPKVIALKEDGLKIFLSCPSHTLILINQLKQVKSCFPFFVLSVNELGNS